MPLSTPPEWPTFCDQSAENLDQTGSRGGKVLPSLGMGRPSQRFSYQRKILLLSPTFLVGFSPQSAAPAGLGFDLGGAVGSAVHGNWTKIRYSASDSLHPAQYSETRRMHTPPCQIQKRKSV